jgi:hypothetical protein
LEIIMTSYKPPGGDVGGKIGARKTEGGFGASSGDIARGYQDARVDDETLEYAHQDYVPIDTSRQLPFKNAGQIEDCYEGGLLPRRPYRPNER